MSFYVENARVLDIVGISAGDSGPEVILEIILLSKEVNSFARLLLNDGWEPHGVKHLGGSTIDVITHGHGSNEYSLVLPFKNQSGKRKLQMNIGKLSAIEAAEWIQNLPFIDSSKTPFTPHPMASNLDKILTHSVDKKLCPPEEFIPEESFDSGVLSEEDMRRIVEFFAKDLLDDCGDEKPF